MSPSFFGVEDHNAPVPVSVLYLLDDAVSELVVGADSVHSKDDMNTVRVAFEVLLDLVNTYERFSRLYGTAHKRVFIRHCVVWLEIIPTESCKSVSIF